MGGSAPPEFGARKLDDGELASNVATHVLSEVLKHSRATNGDRLVMIVLADEAGKETREACCSVELIAQYTLLSLRAVQYSIRRLVALGEISVVGRARPHGIGHKQDWTVYRINDLTASMGANSAPLQPSERGANSAPTSSPKGVQFATSRGADSAPLNPERGAICDTKGVQNATHTYSGSYSVDKNILSSSASRSSTERALAEALLEELNRRTLKDKGRGFPPTETNLRLIVHRIRETDAATVLKVTVRKILEWANSDMEKYLRPKTLYNAQNFSQYVGEVGTKVRRSDGRKVADAFSREHLSTVTAPMPGVWLPGTTPTEAHP